MTQSSDLLKGVTKGAQSTFLITNGKVIWIDPFQVSGDNHPKADIVFILSLIHISEPTRPS